MSIESNDMTRQESYGVNPVGYTSSKYHHFDDVPHPHGDKGWGEDTSQIILYPEHANGLGGLDGYSHIVVLFWIHRSGEWKMPAKSHKPAHVKVFATRMPVRPNPIGLSVVELLNFSPENGVVLVKGLDALDGTPILDIKPYIPDFDSYPEATLPKWVGVHLKEHHHGDHGHGHHHTHDHGHQHTHDDPEHHHSHEDRGHDHDHEDCLCESTTEVR
ncbi:MAG: tRNA (N6-threonylcarbamoyladenosine(37)-N6)-methyltransferase TrmO [Candidatus Methanogaster sp.]|uniref:tRNA (N6-threonylcarbamoyladenosine(37)-N6)-methyltransferase TrmO n=1 Tax=Candidatus Methanogaster sp. TaxID=3386292 RepID=A0AC61L007_9EURY|nr:MAG: tRNA (N6-threonylcarbamoyladenosine(37)-N6)-methyltransferase TrmO [ANME-2 cluster archaeon]